MLQRSKSTTPETGPMPIAPVDRDEIRNLALGALAANGKLEAAAGKLAQECSSQPPTTLEGVDALRVSVAAALKYRELHQKYETMVRPEAWALDVSETRRAIADCGGRWWRFLSKRW